MSRNNIKYSAISPASSAIQLKRILAATLGIGLWFSFSIQQAHSAACTVAQPCTVLITESDENAEGQATVTVETNATTSSIPRGGATFLESRLVAFSITPDERFDITRAAAYVLRENLGEGTPPGGISDALIIRADEFTANIDFEFLSEPNQLPANLNSIITKFELTGDNLFGQGTFQAGTFERPLGMPVVIVDPTDPNHMRTFSNGPNPFPIFEVRITSEPMPEPSTMALFGTGLLLLGVLRSRRKRTGKM